MATVTVTTTSTLTTPTTKHFINLISIIVCVVLVGGRPSSSSSPNGEQHLTLLHDLEEGKDVSMDSLKAMFMAGTIEKGALMMGGGEDDRWW